MPRRLSKTEKIAILERLPLFESCTKKELADVAAVALEAERVQGSFLTREGRDGGLLFVIVEGQARVSRNGRRIGTLGPGDVVGELSLIDGHARSASVEATTDVVLLEITSDDFRKLVRRSPKFVKNLLAALSVKVRQTEALTS
jgi:CRP/FNR family cyclic AMP-dependent transcriptional regulator